MSLPQRDLLHLDVLAELDRGAPASPWKALVPGHSSCLVWVHRLVAAIATAFQRTKGSNLTSQSALPIGLCSWAGGRERKRVWTHVKMLSAIPQTYMCPTSESSETDVTARPRWAQRDWNACGPGGPSAMLLERVAPPGSRTVDFACRPGVRDAPAAVRVEDAAMCVTRCPCGGQIAAAGPSAGAETVGARVEQQGRGSRKGRGKMEQLEHTSSSRSSRQCQQHAAAHQQHAAIWQQEQHTQQPARSSGQWPEAGRSGQQLGATRLFRDKRQ